MLHLADYWSSMQASGIVVSLFAGAAGATIVSAHLVVIATGVMMALALVPSMALVGLASGILRWGTEVACVLAAGGTVHAIKRRFLHNRHGFD
jgi:hypothetical protein